VPDNRPVALLKAAHTGLLRMLKPSVFLSASAAVGWKT
jgi:hypothetical protein